MMKYKRNKGIPRIFVLLIGIMLIVSMSGLTAFAEGVPGSSDDQIVQEEMSALKAKAEAATDTPGMIYGTSALESGVNTADAQTVVLGADDDGSYYWRVIGYDGSGAASESGTATLLAAGNMGQTWFSGKARNTYAESSLRDMIEGPDGRECILDGLSELERGAIRARTLFKGGYADADTDCIAGDADLTGVLLWPLSIKEAIAVSFDLRIVDPEHTDDESNSWWLRSPGAI
ncbi:MAG: hypothetical protein K5707_07430 [Clostridia bacterium]|nr:hypothetical protein [Clostridia bacterium]